MTSNKLKQMIKESDEIQNEINELERENKDIDKIIDIQNEYQRNIF